MNASKNKSNKSEKDKDDNPQGYPLYPESEDIYENFEEKSEINPEDISKTKAVSDDNVVRQTALDKKYKHSGKDLDVPGSDLDDSEEIIGGEDEENNYYSLGGDNHDN